MKKELLMLIKQLPDANEETLIKLLGQLSDLAQKKEEFNSALSEIIDKEGTGWIKQIEMAIFNLINTNKQPHEIEKSITETKLYISTLQNHMEALEDALSKAIENNIDEKKVIEIEKGISFCKNELVKHTTNLSQLNSTKEKIQLFFNLLYNFAEIIYIYNVHSLKNTGTIKEAHSEIFNELKELLLKISANNNISSFMPQKTTNSIQTSDVDPESFSGFCLNFSTNASGTDILFFMKFLQNQQIVSELQKKQDTLMKELSYLKQTQQNIINAWGQEKQISLQELQTANKEISELEQQLQQKTIKTLKEEKQTSSNSDTPKTSPQSFFAPIPSAPKMEEELYNLDGTTIEPLYNLDSGDTTGDLNNLHNNANEDASSTPSDKFKIS